MKTMNTLLHVFEAYTELYRVDHKQEVKEHLMWMMDLIANKIYNPSSTDRKFSLMINGTALLTCIPMDTILRQPGWLTEV